MRGRSDEEKVLRALRFRRELMQADGSVTIAAIRLKVERSTVYRVLREDNRRIELEMELLTDTYAEAYRRVFKS